MPDRASIPPPAAARQPATGAADMSVVAQPPATARSFRRLPPRRLARDWFGMLVLFAAAALLLAQFFMLILFDIL